MPYIFGGWPAFPLFSRSPAHHDKVGAPSPLGCARGRLFAEKPALVLSALPQRVGEIERRFLPCVSSNPIVGTSAYNRTVSLGFPLPEKTLCLSAGRDSSHLPFAAKPKNKDRLLRKRWGGHAVMKLRKSEPILKSKPGPPASPTVSTESKPNLRSEALWYENRV
jgi:hypothetical protein